MKLLLLTLFVSSVFSLSSRSNQHLKSAHMLNQELCRKKNGIVCGLIQKDCCATGCKSFLGLNEVCSDGKMIDLNASTCDKICGSKGGDLYTDQILATPKCCKKGAYAGDKCPQVSQIEMGEC